MQRNETEKATEKNHSNHFSISIQFCLKSQKFLTGLAILLRRLVRPIGAVLASVAHQPIVDAMPRGALKFVRAAFGGRGGRVDAVFFVGSVEAIPNAIASGAGRNARSVQGGMFADEIGRAAGGRRRIVFAFKTIQNSTVTLFGIFVIFF